MKDRDFCKRLISLREAKGITQAQLELRADLPSTTVSHYEKGERKPGLHAIKSLCRGLGCQPNDLISI